jgi:HD-like signal output (HDOD) protein/CheY-like chemotaxis protein
MLEAKKRIIFVDDEPAVLGALGLLLRKERDRWEMVFAPGGASALAEFKKQRFDVVVSDMRMPDMDGAALLTTVKEQYPATVRVMLTGHADSEAILRALPSIHQLLTKPCPARTLRSMLDRCRGLDVVGDATVLAVVGGLDRLPSPPAIFLQLEEIIAGGRATPAQIAAVIEQDPALAAKVLQLANSSYFGDGLATCSIERAVTCVGIERMKYVVLTTSTFSELDGDTGAISVAEIQRDGSETASLVRRLVTNQDPCCEPAFAAALLHDVGHAVLSLGLGAGYRRVFDRARSTNQPLAIVERELLGVTHADVGACLLGIWGLPTSIVDAVRYHHDPGSAPVESREIAAAIHVADSLTQHERIDHESIERASLTARVVHWCAVAQGSR